MRKTSLTLIALFSFASFGLAAPIPVTTCGQTIPKGATGLLQNDLSCPAATTAVAVGIRATLDLDGHTITAAGTGGFIDVHLPGRHTIRGPGQLVNVQVSCGVGFSTRRDVTIRSVDITPTSFAGISCYDEDNENRVTLRDVTVNGPSNFGITGWRVRVKGVTITGSEDFAILAPYVSGRDLSIVGTNGRAIWFADGYPKDVRLTNADIRDNAGAGVTGLRVRLRDSTVTGNGFADVIPTGFDYDVGSSFPPKLTDTTCDRSRKSGQSATWGVCTLD
jgi:hypothetical protein